MLTLLKLFSTDRHEKLDGAYDQVASHNQRAIDILREEIGIGNERAVQALAKIRYEPRNAHECAIFAVHAGRFEEAIQLGEAAIGPLRACLGWSTPKREFKIAAIQALAALHAVEDLINYLAQLGAYAELVEYRGLVCAKLGELRDPRAVAILLAELEIVLQDEQGQQNVQSVSYYSQRTAAWALGEIGDTRAAEPLQRAVIRMNEASLDAAYALFKLSGSRPALEALACMVLQILEQDGDRALIGPACTAMQNLAAQSCDTNQNVLCLFVAAVLEAGPAVNSTGHDRILSALSPARIRPIVEAGPVAVEMLAWILEVRKHFASLFHPTAYGYEKVAIALLGQIATPPALNTLLTMFQKEPLREPIARTLGAMQAGVAARELTTAIHDYVIEHYMGGRNRGVSVSTLNAILAALTQIITHSPREVSADVLSEIAQLPEDYCSALLSSAGQAPPENRLSPSDAAVSSLRTGDSEIARSLLQLKRLAQQGLEPRNRSSS